MKQSNSVLVENIPQSIQSTEQYRLFDLPMAPIFKPSVEEFADPLIYISSIRKEAEVYGICKIIPPENWKPPFALDTSTFHFTPRIQKLSAMEGPCRNAQNYFDQLHQYHFQQGTPFEEPPLVEGVKIDFYLLKKLVMDFNHDWERISLELGLSSSNEIESLFKTFIVPFESFMTLNQKSKTNSKRSKVVLPKLVGQESCEICLQEGNDDKMLLCDGCNLGFHMFCLTPPLSVIPEGEWFCIDCLKSFGDDFGFEDGNELSLSDFQIMADNFKKTRFRGKGQVSELEFEKEFWRIIESPFEDVEVQYGADLHSCIHGSGFPTIETDPKNPYSSCPWNLNNISILKESLFRHIENDISGMMIPWIYVGMAFSTFCWHAEDHYTYSINYHHWGETKTWYGIPASNADKFESVMRQVVPELFEMNPNLLFDLTTLLSPRTLIKNNVQVYALDQRPGEFVVTFPRAYHAGFNHGFNFAEAVNFALPDWLSLGHDCILRYKQYKKVPVFSHEELVLRACQRVNGHFGISSLQKELQRIIIDCLSTRASAQETYRHLVIQSIDKNDKNFQCADCHAYCYLNSFSCECQPDVRVCFDHISSHLCECNPIKLVMWIRFQEQELQELLNSIHIFASQSSLWKKQLQEISTCHQKPTLKELQSLLDSSVDLLDVADEVHDLKVFLAAASAWTQKASKVLSKKNHTERTIQGIQQLLREGDALSFECLERNNLQLLESRANEYKEQVRRVLDSMDSMTMSLTLLTDLYDQGIKLEIKMPEIQELTLFIQCKQWEESAKSFVSGESTDSKAFEDCISKGRMAGYLNNPMMLSMLQIEARANEWRAKVEDLLSKELLLDQMESLLQDRKGLPCDSSLVLQVESKYNRMVEWKQKANTLFTLKEGRFTIDNDKKPLYEDVFAFLKGYPKSIALDTAVINEGLRQTEAWLTRGKKVMGKTNSARTFSLMLIDLSDNIQSCTSRIHNDDVFCICHKPHEESTVMIECEDCKNWYHLPCVKVSKKQCKTDSQYFCPICSVSFANIKSTHKHPTFQELQVFYKEGQELFFPNRDVESLRLAIQSLVEFQNQVQMFIKQEQLLDIAQLKNFSRSCEGINVILEPELYILRRLVKGYSRARVSACTCDTVVEKEEYNVILCDLCDQLYHMKCMNIDNLLEARSFCRFSCDKCKVDPVSDIHSVSGDKKGKIMLKLGPKSVTSLVINNVKEKPKMSREIASLKIPQEEAGRAKRSVTLKRTIYSTEETIEDIPLKHVIPQQPIPEKSLKKIKETREPKEPKEKKELPPKKKVKRVIDITDAQYHEQILLMEQLKQQDAVISEPSNSNPYQVSMFQDEYQIPQEIPQELVDFSYPILSQPFEQLITDQSTPLPFVLGADPSGMDDQLDTSMFYY